MPLVTSMFVVSTFFDVIAAGKLGAPTDGDVDVDTSAEINDFHARTAARAHRRLVEVEVAQDPITLDEQLEEEIKSIKQELKVALKLVRKASTEERENQVAYLQAELKEAEEKLKDLEEKLAAYDGGEVVGDAEDEDGRKLSCHADKLVTIIKFTINGNDDAGAHGEHQLRLNGHKYYPNTAADCKQDPRGYCEWREGQTHSLNNPPQRVIKSWDVLNVGTEEHDVWSENDSYTGDLTNAVWYSKTCSTYSLKIAKNFKPEVKREVCGEIGASVTGGAKGVEGTVEGSIKSCSTWTDPAESYIWIVRVDPMTDARDKNNNCPYWAGLNYCASNHKYGSWMKTNCVVSCRGKTAARTAPAKKGNGHRCQKRAECKSKCCSNTAGGSHTCENNAWYRNCR